MKRVGEHQATVWHAVIHRVFREVAYDDVTGTAAQLAYYFLFSLFPFFIVLVTLAAFLPIEGTAHSAVHELGAFMPKEAMDVVHENVHQLLGQTRPRLLGLGLLVTLWTSSRGVDALRKGLNRAWDVTESRPFWKTQAIAAGVTVAGAVFVLVAVAAVLVGSRAGESVVHRLHLDAATHAVLPYLTWVLAAIAILFVLSVCYAVLPDVPVRLRLLTPGAVFATGSWLLGTFGLTKYVELFGQFNVAYGSIGGAIVLLLWLYVSAFVILVGGEMNAAAERVRRVPPGTTSLPP